MLELAGDFFWEEEGVCGGLNKWKGATMGPRGRGSALDPRGQVLAPPAMFSVPDIFGVFLYCTDNSENRQKILILLYFN